MRLKALIALIPLAACTTTTTDDGHPYAEANSLMRREIQSRITQIPFLHRQELLNTMLWLSGKAGEMAIPDLLDALDHNEPKVRSSVLWVLGRIRDRRVIPQLQSLVKDENPAVRMEAARTLVTMGDMQHTPILIEGLDSEMVPVRYHCHMALRDATNRDFDYDHLEEDMTSRRTAALRWREWWGKQQNDPWFAVNYAKEHGLTLTTTDVAAPVPMTETKGSGMETIEHGETTETTETTEHGKTVEMTETTETTETETGESTESGESTETGETTGTTGETTGTTGETTGTTGEKTETTGEKTETTGEKTGTGKENSHNQ